MKTAPPPANEQARLKALRSYCILNTPPEYVFDQLTELAANICKVPIATITLIDEDREWYKSKVGITDEEAPRNISFCAHTILGRGLFIVPDTLKDERFADNPFVTENPPLRFYAAFPLITEDDHAIGTMCVIDHIPRRLNKFQKKALQTLAELVVTLLESRRKSQELLDLETKARNLDFVLSKTENRYQFLVESMTDGLIMQDEHEIITFVNDWCCVLSGYSNEELVGQSITLLFDKKNHKLYMEQNKKRKKGELNPYEIVLIRKDGHKVNALVSQQLILDANGNFKGSFAVITDITSRKQLEAELEKRIEERTIELQNNVTARKKIELERERFLNILDASINEIYMFNANTLGFEYVNSGALNNLGYDFDQIKTMTPIDIKPEYTETSFRKMLQPLLRHDKSIHIFYTKHLRADGSTYPVEVHLQLVEFGKERTFLAIILDITERKRIEDRLTLLNFTINSAKEAIYLVDRSARFIDVNQAACNELGYSRRELLSMTVLDINPEITWEIWEKHWNEIRAEKTFMVETVHCRKDSSTFPVEVSVSNFEFEGKDYNLALVRDITERKRAENEIHARQKQLELVADNFPGLVARVDRNLRYLFVNKQYEKWFGIPCSQIIGKTVREIIGEESFKTAEPNIKKVLSGKRITYENPVISKSGEIMYGLVTQTPDMDKEGNIHGFYTTVLDINDRKKAELELKHYTDRLEQAEKHALLGSWEVDVKSGKAWWSKSMYSLLGFEITDELPGMEDFLEHFHPDDRNNLQDAYTKMTCGTVPELHDFRSNPALGSIKYFTPTLFYDKDENGVPIRFFGTVLDITRLKQIEEALRASETKLSNALKIAKAGHWEFDVVKNQFTFNDHFYSMLHTNAREIGGYSMTPSEYARQFVHPEDIHMIEEEVKAALETTDTNYTKELEHRIIYADGKTGYIAVRIYIEKDSNGKTIKTYGVNQDITERVLNESALRESELRFRNVAKATSDTIWDWNLITDQVWWNDGVQKLFGYHPEEIEPDSSSWTTRIHPKEKDRIVNNIHELINGKTDNWQDEYHFRRKDGSYAYVLDRGFIIRDENGKAVRMIGGMTDLTENKEIQENLHETSEQLRALAGKLQGIREEERTHIAREIHDVLAQELTRLKLSLVWSNKRISCLNDPFMKNTLEKKMQEMIDQTNLILEEVQKISTELRPVILDSLGLCAAIEWLAEDFSKRTDMLTNVIVPENEPDINYEEATVIFRILQESLTNVVRHAQATQVYIELQQKNNYLYLIVQDNGCGIKPDKTNDINSIGLLGMRERALALNGSVSITGEPNDGTTVTVKIPHNLVN